MRFMVLTRSMCGHLNNRMNKSSQIPKTKSNDLIVPFVSSAPKPLATGQRVLKLRIATGLFPTDKSTLELAKQLTQPLNSS